MFSILSTPVLIEPSPPLKAILTCKLGGNACKVKARSKGSISPKSAVGTLKTLKHLLGLVPVASSFNACSTFFFVNSLRGLSLNFGNKFVEVHF